MQQDQYACYNQTVKDQPSQQLGTMRQDLPFYHFPVRIFSCNPVVGTLQVQAGRPRKIRRAYVRSAGEWDPLAVARTSNKGSDPDGEGFCL